MAPENTAAYTMLVQHPAELIDAENMQGKRECAGKRERVAEVQAEIAAFHAQAVKTNQRYTNGDAEQAGGLATEENAEDRNDQDIQGGDETGFGGSSVLDADLLEYGGDRETATAHGTDQQVFLELLRRFLTAQTVEKRESDCQYRTGDDTAQEHESVWTDKCHCTGLGGESGAPEKGTQKQEYGTFCVVFR